MFRTRGFIFRKTVLPTCVVLFVYMPTVSALWHLQDCLYRWLVNRLYHTCTYNRLPEDKPSSSKHVEDIVKIIILVQQRCILLVCIIRLYYNTRCKKHNIHNPNRIVSTSITNWTERSEYKLCCCTNLLRAQDLLQYPALRTRTSILAAWNIARPGLSHSQADIWTCIRAYKILRLVCPVLSSRVFNMALTGYE